MIIYLYGPDSYRRGKKLNVLLREYKQKYPQADLFFADFEDEPESLGKAEEFLNQPSIFVESKVLVLRENNAILAENEKKWAKILKSHIETQKTFVLISDKAVPKKAFEFLLEKPIMSQKFEVLQGALLDFFLKQEADDRGLDFSAEAFDFFSTYIDSTAEKSWIATRELDKIALAGFSQNITPAEVSSIIRQFQKGEVPFLSRRILTTADTAKKLSFLEKMFLQKEEPAYIFNSLAYQARGEDAVRFADYDVSIKSGGLEYEEALTDFAIGDRRI